jgi:hypothetical protein
MTAGMDRRTDVILQAVDITTAIFFITATPLTGAGTADDFIEVWGWYH